LRRCIDPVTRAFELGIKSQGRFVENTMAPLIGPFRAPFFIDEYGTEAEGLEDLPQHRAILDHGLSFYAIFVRALFCLSAGDALVRDHPFVAIFANAQNLP
jgi:hypothetical protein